ncbi:O-methyltransferase-domain-containing protein [Zopfochytrium polystomum]|nr:O-methyltransferase-domain-containing protein [Zopfochytrium polystomum]
MKRSHSESHPFYHLHDDDPDDDEDDDGDCDDGGDDSLAVASDQHHHHNHRYHHHGHESSNARLLRRLLLPTLPPSPAVSPEPVLDVIQAFKKSGVLFAAIGIGLFDVLADATAASGGDDGVPLDEVLVRLRLRDEGRKEAANGGFYGPAIDRVLRTLAAMGFVSLSIPKFHEGDKGVNGGGADNSDDDEDNVLFSLTPTSREYLLSTGEHSLTGYALYTHQATWPLFNVLAHSLRTGRTAWDVAHPDIASPPPAATATAAEKPAAPVPAESPLPPPPPVSVSGSSLVAARAMEAAGEATGATDGDGDAASTVNGDDSTGKTAGSGSDEGDEDDADADADADPSKSPNPFKAFYATPAHRERFLRGMHSHMSIFSPPVAGAFNLDFLQPSAAITSGTLAVADVGGATGALAHAFAARWPHLRGAVAVVDLPHVADEVVALGFFPAAARITPGQTTPPAAASQPVLLATGDFFAADPAAQPPPAQLYVLSRILHDWSDADCVRILACLRARVAGPFGAVMVAETFLDARRGRLRAAPVDNCVADMTMLVATGGLERSPRQMTALLRAAGFKGKVYVRRTGAYLDALLAFAE